MLLWSFDFNIKYGKENRLLNQDLYKFCDRDIFKIQEKLSHGKINIGRGQWKLQMRLISEVNVEKFVES